MTRIKTSLFPRVAFSLPWLALVFSLCLAPDSARGEVVFDGSLGDPGSLSGDMVISSDRGKTVGDNLFHSFEIFNVNNGESALFTGPGNISNIISRVTGGELSTIDGSIDHTMPGAAFWLINPNGVVFGANASLPTTGSFHVATADYLKLGDDGRFGADLNLPENTVLTVASPSAFGFVGPGLEGEITATGSNLNLDAGQTLSMVGGGVTLQEGTQINISQGRVNLAAAGAAGELPVDLRGVSPAGGITTGDITLSTTGVNTDGPGGGSIFIRGGEFVMTDSGLSAVTEGEDAGGEIDIDVSDFFMSGESFIDTATFGEGKGGNIQIVASGAMFIDLPNWDWGIFCPAFAGGDAGAILINAGSFTFSGGLIQNGTVGLATGGDISITAGDFNLDNFGTIQSITVGPGSAGDIHVDAEAVAIANNAQVDSVSTDSGNGGSIVIDAGSFSLAGDSFVTNRTFGSGQGGNIAIMAGDFQLDNFGTVQSITQGPGRAGDIQVDAGAVTITNYGNIDSLTAAGGGSAGDIVVNASGSMTIDGGLGTGVFNRVDSGAGESGSIQIAAFDLDLLDSGEIVTRTSEESFLNGGNIVIDVQNTFNLDGIFAEVITTARGSGRGGDIVVSAREVNIGPNGNGGALRTETFQSGPGGSITIDAENLNLGHFSEITTAGFGSGKSGDIDINLNGKLSLTDGWIDSEASWEGGDGGNINISAAELGIDFGEISSSTPADGNAGNITIAVDRFRMVDGSIRSEAEFYSTTGHAGNISLEAGESLRITGTEENFGSFVGSTTVGSGDAGNITIESPLMEIDHCQINSYGGSGFSIVAADGAGGDIDIRGGEVYLAEKGLVSAGTGGNGPGGNIRIDVDILAVADGAQINTQTMGLGDAGNIEILAADGVFVLGGGILVDGEDEIFLGSNISTSALGAARDGFLSGNAGDISIFTGNLVLLDGGFLSSQTFTNGLAGNINIQATDTVLISGYAGPVAQSGVVTSTGAGALALEEPTGRAGDITIVARELYVLDGGVIESETTAEGDAGTISIEADNFVIRDTIGIDMGIEVSTKSKEESAGAAGDVLIDAGSLTLEGIGGLIKAGTEGAGTGGSISIQADKVSILNDGGISAVARGSGKAGNITLAVSDEIVIQGEPSDRPEEDTGIFANTFGSGDAGVIDVSAPTLKMSGTGRIESGTIAEGKGGTIQLDLDELMMQGQAWILTATYGDGDAGNVIIDVAGKMKVDGQNSEIEGGVISGSLGAGQGGDLDISAKKFELKNGGRFSASSVGTGDAGEIRITARDHMELDGYFIRTRSDNSSGGNIIIEAGDYVFLDHSEITTSSLGVTPGNDGGNITIDPDFIILKESSILAQANAGNGGNITLVAESLLVDPDSTIDASSQTGIDGEIVVNAPNQDITGGLVALDVSLIDVSKLLRRRCAIQALSDRSSFTVEKATGTIDSPETFAVGLHPDDIGSGHMPAAPRNQPIPVLPPNETSGDSSLNGPNSRCPGGCPE